jgi:hypothetical protein
MNSIKFLAILAALFLTSAEFLVIDHDARQRAARYQVEVAQPAQHG